MFKPSLAVCLSTELFHLMQPEGKTVVIVDIFRATSTITSAFWHGCKAIKTVTSPEEALKLREENYIVAGEQNGDIISGFDLGNSPVALKSFDFSGKKMSLVTTNGTKALNMSLKASEILTGSFHNLDLLAEYLNHSNRDVIIFCSGWKGHPCLEDSLFAGALVDRLERNFTAHQDAALLCNDLYNLAKTDLYAYCTKASHYARLHEKGIEEDMRNCLELNIYPVVPNLDFESLELILMNK
ncbi:MAG: 2-phosphosulfolactate phosphatase [Cytophagales bacterium]